MARFYPLTVTAVEKTTRDAVVITLEARDGGNFTFTQGQYLTFKRDFDGTEIRRSYSICSGANEGVLRVGIKKVADGAFSQWANTDLQPGMTLDAMEPMGKFNTPIEPDKAKTYLAFAGGSGITPVLSILKTVLAAEPKSQVTLVYANRSVSTIMFREELEDLKNLYMGRVTIIHILETDAQDIDLFQGRVDGEKCAALFTHWIHIESVDTAFICGPEPMMKAIAKALGDHGLSKKQIKFELFASAQTGRLKRRTKAADGAATDAIAARITLDGMTRSFEMGRDMTILEAALDNALDAPHACRAGVCSTCKCKVLEGEVDMVANHALEDYEVAAGYVLSCQSYPITKRVVVDYDQ
ncbi:2Fe-2S iron-sulfur cluster-binding protein [Marivita sp. XM-24bin2]|jgi:ring-1,2-phenylacetyl-CoA epoxidase subunit PaaE|uniref:2Fe-2S iron-sulfur cluster-binding protein n=1 Tax=unclassified Marivita TaxID=2632480 RepID=UPI000D797F8B|nr:2Fe-2S iron-sulfur cluster-binding protein [Marivita sp. XM-24bin2]MCR9108539.1 2Fe-2S iron-sulfur cluster-binding protein [Paracoccaceae bacterium]PWL34717.1 MAG: phenylacetic acid degradation protein [Marivita sp. XM-24bin2]